MDGFLCLMWFRFFQTQVVDTFDPSMAYLMPFSPWIKVTIHHMFLSVGLSVSLSVYLPNWSAL